MPSLLALLLCVVQDPGVGTGAAPKPDDAAARIEREARNERGEPAWFTREQLTKCSAAADRGLEWLRSRQLASGGWVGIVGHKQGDSYDVLAQSLLPEEQERSGHGHLGVTALCGMAFLAGGNLPDRGAHAAVLTKVVDYVARTSQESGLLTDSGTRMYSHAFATLFLAEVHGMAATSRTKATLERAVNLIVDSQNGYGGWRYNPFDREIDLSVTVCQLQALRAARNIGIRVPTGTIDKAMAYVNASRVGEGPLRGLYYYKIHGRGNYQKPTEYAINAAALTALSSAGVHDENLVDPVLTFLGREYPNLADSYYRTHFYYWYGNYYAAQAFYQYGGARLRGWFARLADDLLEAQASDGRWRNHVGPGDEFATAVACILLLMPKQYLPIFQR